MISIIVPCYNEQEALPLFHKEITRVLQEMGESYELCWSTMAPEIAHWT